MNNFDIKITPNVISNRNFSLLYIYVVIWYKFHAKLWDAMHITIVNQFRYIMWMNLSLHRTFLNRTMSSANLHGYHFGTNTQIRYILGTSCIFFFQIIYLYLWLRQCNVLSHVSSERYLLPRPLFIDWKFTWTTWRDIN